MAIISKSIAAHQAFQNFSSNFSYTISRKSFDNASDDITLAAKVYSKGDWSIFKQRVNNLSSVILSSQSAHPLLVHENTPASVALNTLYPFGACFATSSQTLSATYADISPLDLSSLPVVSNCSPIFCAGGSRVFGHFLLQTLPKLLLAKELGLFDTHLFIFSSDIPSFFLKFADYIGLLPNNYSLYSPSILAFSTASISFSITPIMSTVTLNTLRLNKFNLTDSPMFESGYGLALDLYKDLQHLIVMHAPSNCSLTTDQCKRVYIVRKTGTHRDLINRVEIANYASANGFFVVSIEDLSLDEQFFLFSNCRLLITEVGSTACNSWLMPNLIAGLELCIDSVYGAWGLLLASSINNFTFYRVNGTKVMGSQTRWDGDASKAPLETDYDFTVPFDDFQVAFNYLVAHIT